MGTPGVKCPNLDKKGPPTIGTMQITSQSHHTAAFSTKHDKIYSNWMVK